MPRNSGGTYIAPAGSWNPAVNMTNATLDDFNALLTDIVNAFTASIAVNGVSVVTANIPMASHKFTGLAAGTTAGDSVRYEQVIGAFQPLDATLTALAALTITATTYIKGTGTDAFSVVAPSVILADTGAASLTTAQSWTANQSIGATLANIFDQVGAQRPVTSAASDTSTTIGGSTAALAIVNNNTTANNVAQLDFAALTGANANYYTGGIIAVQFAARTNAQYVQSDMFFQTSPATNNAPTTKLTIKNTGELIATQQSPTSIYALGYLGAPATGTPNSAYGLVLADAGGQLYHDEVTARTWTIPANASVAFPIGTVIIGDNTGNSGAAGVLTLSITSDTLRRGDGTAGTGSRTIAALGVFAIRKTKSTEWVITGSGIT